MLERNKYVKARREAKGSVLTDKEITDAHQAFQEQWESYTDNGRDFLKKLYDESRIVPATEAAAPIEYCPVWGGGNSSTAITCQELHPYWKKN